jgi:class 3 adenylate cyclase
MICKSCGFDNPVGMNYCGRCSRPLSDLPSGVVTYLFTDIEGSTPLWARYPERMGPVLVRHDALLTAAIEAHGGSVVRSRGEDDSFFAVFVRAGDATAAACAMQQAILGEPWPADLDIKVRMALHTGESELRDHDYYGAVVNRAARLRSIAHGGQVVLSQATFELVQDALPDGVTLRDMGSHRLKGIDRPEQVFQMLHANLPSEFPPLVSLDTVRHALPTQLTRFIGRDEEIREVAGLLPTARLVTLAGAGGSGKTRLSQEIGATVMDDYAGGVWFVGLVDVADANMLRSHVAKVFDVGEDALHGFLQAKPVLIILDNCEHLIAGATSLAQWLLTSPGVSLIATSREPLGLPGERMFQVPPLPIPAEGDLGVVLDDCPSVQLFVDRAQAAKPGFELTSANASAVNQIVRRVDEIPLAIELAASRVKLLQPAEIAARLDDIFKILTGGGQPRCRTTRRWSARSTGATTCWTKTSAGCFVDCRCSGVGSRWRRARRSAGWMTSLRRWTR